MQTVYLSIGSNIEPDKNIALAKDFLNKHYKCTFSSSYESEASGFEGDDFINLVVRFSTDEELINLWNALKEIERLIGRNLSQKGMSNRVIDLDIILYGDLIIDNEFISLPSKDIENYLFVLKPLAEIAGNSLHPTLERTYKDLLKDFTY
jgi:2-amino-4-hydroxy-6-hydroxymethyldihydropteridine diphosphokinase